MKDLQSKEQSYYEIHTLLTKGSAYNPSIYKPYMDWGPPPPPPPPPLPVTSFLQENVDLPFYDFSKISLPL